MKNTLYIRKRAGIGYLIDIEPQFMKYMGYSAFAFTLWGAKRKAKRLVRKFKNDMQNLPILYEKTIQ